VAAQSESYATASAVPADAVLYSVTNLDLESAQWQQVEELLSRLGIPDALDQFRVEAVTGIGEEPTREEFDALLGGEAAFFVLPSGVESLVEQFQALNAQMAEMGMGTPGAAGEMAQMPDVEVTGVGAIIEPSDPELAWDYVGRHIASQADSGVVQMVETTEGDVSLVTLTPSDPEAPELVLANTGSFIVIAGNIIDVQTVIDTANGEADSIADHEAFNQVLGELPAETAWFSFYDSTQVMGMLGSDFMEGIYSLSPELAPSAETASFGGVALWADDEGFRLDSVTIPAEGSDLSAMVPDGTVTFSERVPASTTIFAGGIVPDGTWNSAALSAAMAINAGMMGQALEPQSFDEMFSEEAIQAQLDQAEQVLGFDLLDDFFAQLSGETAFALTFPDMMAMGAVSINTVFVSEVEDGAVVAESIEKLVRMLSSMAGDEFPVTTESVGDDTLYVIGDPATTGVPAVQVGVVENQLLIGTEEGVTGFLEGVSEPLSADAQYQEVLGLLPGGEYYQVAYIDLTDIIPTVMALSGGMMGASGAGIEDADPACLEYDSQEDAQAAYDEDPFTNSNLDQDFDGQACEDLFAPAAAASPVAPSGGIEALESFAAVAYEEDGKLYSSAILRVGEVEE
jgi:hypothetical protein